MPSTCRSHGKWRRICRALGRGRKQIATPFFLIADVHGILCPHVPLEGFAKSRRKALAQNDLRDQHAWADEIVPVGDTADRSLNWRSRAGLVDRDLEVRSSDPPVISCGEVESLGRVPFFEIDKLRLSVSAEAFGRWSVDAEQSQ